MRHAVRVSSNWGIVMSGRAVISALLALAWLGQCAAAGTAGAEETLLDLMRAHPECRQFSDGCSICRVENGTASCSAPAIACIRTGWACPDAGADTPSQEGASLVHSTGIALAGALGREVARLPEP
jgi:hypothetical protein